MLPLVIVQVACERVGSLTHVLRHASLFLLDVYTLQLRDVVQANDLELLKYLVLDPKCPLGGGFSVAAVEKAMEMAIAENKMTFLQFLLTEAPSIQVSGLPTYVLAEFCAIHGNLEALEWLLEHHQVSCYKWVLDNAAKSGHLHVLRFLIQVVTDQQGDDAVDSCHLVQIAIQNGHDHVVKHLLKASNLNNEELRSLRHGALNKGLLRLVGWIDVEFSEMPFYRESLETHMQYSGEQLGKRRDVEELKWFVQQYPESSLDAELLVYASEAGDVTKVEWLLDTLKLPTKHEALQEALARACAHGHIDCVKVLLQHGANLKSLVQDQAVMNGHVEMVEFLQVEHNLTFFKDFDTSMQKAAENMHLEMVQCFDVSKPFPPGALIKATVHGNIPMLQFLLSTPHDVKVYREMMKEAFFKGQVQSAQVLYEHITSHGLQDTIRDDFRSLRTELQETPIRAFDSNGHLMLGVFFLLLSQEPTSDLEGEDFSQILYAAHLRSNQVPLIQFLYDRKVAGFENDMISRAAGRGFFKMVRFFLEHFSHEFVPSAFCEAAENGYLNIVKYLFPYLGKELVVDIQRVARNGHWRVVQFLCEHESTILDSPSMDSPVPEAFLEAARNGHLQVVKYLLENYESREELDVEEAFHLACCGAFVNLVQWFLDHEAAHVDAAVGLQVARKALETAKRKLEVERMIAFLEDQLTAERSPVKRHRIASE